MRLYASITGFSLRAIFFYFLLAFVRLDEFYRSHKKRKPPLLITRTSNTHHLLRQKIHSRRPALPAAVPSPFFFLIFLHFFSFHFLFFFFFFFFSPALLSVSSVGFCYFMNRRGFAIFRPTPRGSKKSSNNNNNNKKKTTTRTQRPHRRQWVERHARAVQGRGEPTFALFFFLRALPSPPRVRLDWTACAHSRAPGTSN
ncbi:hypothetical protein SEUBUCD646_0D01950 [Saccharomyces eubayanus]|uniref:Uncharacterized protein n=1 Tax=Saccharomyces eubayanus TaxID=1080349 RepID=A0ABN8VT41_SACEU|nr:hypothetical protein SEUBUCD650_0D01940 [Saccharomyces eubayanus]CAI1936957.1 hypothetical protein SEUBUCD646_0D01950 [Saccharomyces eubayanus]